MNQKNGVERDSGVALWRQIADALRLSISGGLMPENSMMPGEMALATRFGVNRHTVRAAIAALVDEGLLQTAQGRGTMVRKAGRYTFPISRRTRFSEGLADQSRDRRLRLMTEGIEPASPPMAEALGIASGSALVRLDLVSTADQTPLSYARNWFRSDLLSGIGEAFRETGSVTLSLKRLGIADYIRHSTEVTARLADEEERHLLDLRPGAVVMVSRAVNATPEGIRLQYAETSFAADRVALSIESSN